MKGRMQAQEAAERSSELQRLGQLCARTRAVSWARCAWARGEPVYWALFRRAAVTEEVWRAQGAGAIGSLELAQRAADVGGWRRAVGLCAQAGPAWLPNYVAGGAGQRLLGAARAKHVREALQARVRAVGLLLPCPARGALCWRHARGRVSSKCQIKVRVSSMCCFQLSRAARGCASSMARLQSVWR